MIADPFLPLLTEFVGKCNYSTVVILSLRCLGFFLLMNLPSVPLCAKRLGPYILKLLTYAGAKSNSRNEICQEWFKTLTLPMNFRSAADWEILELNGASFLRLKILLVFCLLMKSKCILLFWSFTLLFQILSIIMQHSVWSRLYLQPSTFLLSTDFSSEQENNDGKKRCDYDKKNYIYLFFSNQLLSPASEIGCRT